MATIDKIHPQVDAVLRAVALSYFGYISRDDLLSKSRVPPLTEARALAVYVLRECTSLTLNVIGRSLGGRKHCTILQLYKTAKFCSRSDREFRKRLETLVNEFRVRNEETSRVFREFAAAC